MLGFLSALLQGLAALVHLLSRDGRGAGLQGLILGLQLSGVRGDLALNFLGQLLHARLHSLTNGRLGQSLLVEIDADAGDHRARVGRALSLGQSRRSGERSDGESANGKQFHLEPLSRQEGCS
ncbi:hypothetical protein D3C81_1966340 [compost metagenome]